MAISTSQQTFYGLTHLTEEQLAEIDGHQQTS
jgi:hypothetical protein